MDETFLYFKNYKHGDCVKLCNYMWQMWYIRNLYYLILYTKTHN